MAYADAGGHGEGGSLCRCGRPILNQSFKPEIIFLKKTFHILKTIIPFP